MDAVRSPYIKPRSLQQAPERVLGPEPGAAVLAALLDDPQGVPWQALASGTTGALAEAIRYPLLGVLQEGWWPAGRADLQV